MKSLTLITAAACIVFASSALAQGAPAPEATPVASAAAPAAGEKLICRSERVTGTRNTKRVCRTAEQIQADKEEAQEFTRMGQRKTSAESGGG